jgi:ABC-type proline/glycine betaine transport system ATPase subunit
MTLELMARYDVHHLRRNIGIVAQDNVLFHHSDSGAQKLFLGPAVLRDELFSTRIHYTKYLS